jgi:hypothetical protein
LLDIEWGYFLVIRISRHWSRRSGYIPQNPSFSQRTLFAGISMSAYALWGGRLNSFPEPRGEIRDLVFFFPQIVNLTAIVAIAICVKKYARQVCLIRHLQEAQTRQH